MRIFKLKLLKIKRNDRVMTVKHLLDKTVEFFKRKNIESPRLEAELILYSSFGFKDRMALYLNFEKPVSEAEVVQSRSWVQRRGAGEPLAYILGEKGFFHETYKVGPGVLIPRPETEGLVEEALQWIQKQGKIDIKIADLGAGTGCLGNSTALNLPKDRTASVDFYEMSTEAQQYLKQNTDKISRKIVIENLSNLQKLETNYDIILSNPPYIGISDPRVDESVKKFEPSLALYGGETGLEIINNWFSKFHRQLNTPGLMLVEFGQGQEEAVLELFNSFQVFSQVRVRKDCFGIDRWISAEK